MEHARCSRCKINKPLSEFNRNARRINGHDNNCRTCMRELARAREQARKAETDVPAERQCAVGGCSSRIKGHGYCSKHLQRQKAHGDPLGGAAPRARTTTARYRPKGLTVEQSFRWFLPGEPPREGELWLWPGPQDVNGYGCFAHHGERTYAHRVSYELFVGPIPGGLVVRHKNDIPLDVNPHNLEVGTLADNRMDCVERERVRSARGEHQGSHKLTEAEVVKIRYLYALGGYTYPLLAERFGVTPTAIGKVVRRNLWKHIE